MKFKISTAKMNTILGKLGKGVGNSKILPITEYLRLELVDGNLRMTATDSSNFIDQMVDGVEGENGIAVVKADRLIKLVSKTTKPEVEFELTETHLEVRGNGVYKVELFETNEYPEYKFNEESQGVAVKTEELKKLFATNKSAIASEMLLPCLTGYKIGSEAVTTDGVKMCLNSTAILPNGEILVPQKLADLLQVITADEVYIQVDGNNLLFTADRTIIFGPQLDGIEEFPDISGVMGIPYEQSAVVTRSSLVEALDRVSLFIDNTTNYGVKFTFKEDGLHVNDLKDKTVEAVAYVQKSLTEETELMFNINYLNDLLGASGAENVTLHFGAELPLKIQEEAAILILSTMSPE